MTNIHVSLMLIMGWHHVWRKSAKKLRRKRIRTEKAFKESEIIRKELERREKSPTYIAWVKEQEILEEFAEQEEQRLAAERQLKWEAEEEAAQKRWREQQIRLEQARAEKAKQELLIREEWDREQEKLKKDLEQKEKEKEEKRKRQEELLSQIDAFISGTADLPSSTIVSTETHPGLPLCPFFSKTGACRFRDNCSRNHIRPGISKVLLFTNFYDHFGIHSSLHNEYDTDVGLEYEDLDTYHDFLEFYNDILPEFETCGEIRQLKVCCNHESHLRGNVYVEFFSERHALKAYQQFQGRYYGGRQLSVSFVRVPSWKSALCGLFHKQRCPKGRTCNFLHVFKNPNNAFRDADFDRSPRYLRESSSLKRDTRSPEDWRWSVSPERSQNESPEKRVKKSESKNRNKRKYRDRSRERYSSKVDRDSPSSIRRRRRHRHNSPHRSHRRDDDVKGDSLDDEEGGRNHRRRRGSFVASDSEPHNDKAKMGNKPIQNINSQSISKSSKALANRNCKGEKTPESDL